MNNLTHNVFTARLIQFMMGNHPDRMEDTTFIAERAATAARTFESASMSGMTVDESMAEAERTLFQGLHFSPYLMVQDVLLQHFGYNGDEDELQEFSLQMLEVVRPLIMAHSPDDAFQGSDRYPVLFDQIKDSINQYLVRNGIQ